jgi:hypothetical protein
MEIEQITYIRIVENIYVGCAQHHCKTCFVISYFTVSAKMNFDIGRWVQIGLRCVSHDMNRTATPGPLDTDRAGHLAGQNFTERHPTGVQC